MIVPRFPAYQNEFLVGWFGIGLSGENLELPNTTERPGMDQVTKYPGYPEI